MASRRLTISRDAPAAEASPRALLAGWERTDALSAPAPPAEGALVPNETGYLLGCGPASQRLFPRALSWARVSPAVTVPVLLAFPFLVMPTPYGPGGAALLAGLACWAPVAAVRKLGAGRLRRVVADAPLVPSARMASPGDVVRLRGVVVEQATAPSLFAGRPSVLARSEYGGAVETRGIDFRVRLADGETLYVPARSTLLLGRADRIHGTPACGPVTLRRGEGEPRLVSALLSVRGFLTRLGRLPARELTIAPGDEIEVCGTIAREPAVDGETGFGRTPSVRAVLHPAGEVPALVHKRSAAAGEGDETEWAI